MRLLTEVGQTVANQHALQVDRFQTLLDKGLVAIKNSGSEERQIPASVRLAGHEVVSALELLESLEEDADKGLNIDGGFLGRRGGLSVLPVTEADTDRLLDEHDVGLVVP